MKRSIVNLLAAFLLIGTYALLHNETHADYDAPTENAVKVMDYSPNAIPITLVNTFRQYKELTYYSPLFDHTYVTYYVNEGYRPAGYTVLNQWRERVIQIHWLFRQDYVFW